MPPAGFRSQNVPIRPKNRLCSLHGLFSKTDVYTKVYLVFQDVPDFPDTAANSHCPNKILQIGTPSLFFSSLFDNQGLLYETFEIVLVAGSIDGDFPLRVRFREGGAKG